MHVCVQCLPVYATRTGCATPKMTEIAFSISSRTEDVRTCTRCLAQYSSVRRALDVSTVNRSDHVRQQRVITIYSIVYDYRHRRLDVQYLYVPGSSLPIRRASMPSIPEYTNTHGTVISNNTRRTVSRPSRDVSKSHFVWSQNSRGEKRTTHRRQTMYINIHEAACV